VVVLDPWLSPHGAFDSSWFQLPQNHHLAETVRQKLSDPSKERIVYVSHEHTDHFDPVFLASLPTHEITAVVPFFKRAACRNEMAGFGWKRLVLPGRRGDPLRRRHAPPLRLGLHAHPRL